MQRRTVLSLALAAAVAALVGPARPAVAKPTMPRTVVDYFRLLPKDYFEISDRYKYLQATGTGSTIDLKNDYLFMVGDGAQVPVWVAVFRHAGRALIAVKAPLYDTHPEETRLDFYRYENGAWKNVTRAVSPVAYNPNYRCELPRYGTTIHIKDPAGRNVMDWTWSNGKFIARLP